MTPNGRRRWRRRAKAWRLAERGFGSTVYTPRQSNAVGIARNGAFERRHQHTVGEAYSAYGEHRQLWADTQRRPILDPRQLVGMSQSARKRWARRCAIGAEGDRHWQRTWRAGFAGPSEIYKLARLRFRVGQRLRGCWGCPACRPELRGLLILPSFCDGSGVR